MTGPTLYDWSPIKTAPGVAPVQQTPAASVPVATSSPAEAPKKSGEQSHGQKKEADLESLGIPTLDIQNPPVIPGEDRCERNP